uniref:Coat protein n=1 Tax=Statovirus F1 TaxID=2862951 RepID=A0A8F8SMX5_9VIRU|nr:coat protein [Statovirus F1]
MSQVNKQNNLNKTGKLASKQKKQINTRSNRRRPRTGINEMRFRRDELWFTHDGSGEIRSEFSSTNFPAWFDRMASLYENYEMHEIRIHWISSYNKMSTGNVIASYNSNPNDPVSFEPQYLLAQQGATTKQVSESGWITIPRSAYVRTPSKRPTRGEGSWIFDFLAKITADTEAPIQFYVSYDVTFRTPQLSTQGNGISLSSTGNEGNVTGRSFGKAEIRKEGGKTILAIPKQIGEKVRIVSQTRATENASRFKVYIGDSIKETIKAAAEGLTAAVSGAKEIGQIVASIRSLKSGNETQWTVQGAYETNEFYGDGETTIGYGVNQDPKELEWFNESRYIGEATTVGGFNVPQPITITTTQGRCIAIDLTDSFQWISEFTVTPIGNEL